MRGFIKGSGAPGLCAYKWPRVSVNLHVPIQVVLAAVGFITKRAFKGAFRGMHAINVACQFSGSIKGFAAMRAAGNCARHDEDVMERRLRAAVAVRERKAHPAALLAHRLMFNAFVRKWVQASCCRCHHSVQPLAAASRRPQQQQPVTEPQLQLALNQWLIAVRG